MQITYLNDDLFTAPCYFTLVNCTSRKCELTSSIGKQFDSYFNLGERLSNYTRIDNGDWLNNKNSVECGNVINLFVKDNPDDKITYEALSDALCDLEFTVRDSHITHLAMPKICCGAGGLDWDKVEQMLEAVFDGDDVDICVYCR